MVQGVAKFKARMRNIPEVVRAEIVKQLEKEAGKVVAFMASLNPLPGTIRIDWTWGDTPAGAVTIGTVRGQEHDRIAITIYATASTSKYPGGIAAIARWWEFGTAPRRQKTTGRYTGYIPASPFFYPAWRAERRRVKGNIARAVKRGFKKA